MTATIVVMMLATVGVTCWLLFAMLVYQECL